MAILIGNLCLTVIEHAKMTKTTVIITKTYRIWKTLSKIGNTSFYNKTIRSLSAILFPYLQTQRQLYTYILQTENQGKMILMLLH